jgi:hypothetical protein
MIHQGVSYSYKFRVKRGFPNYLEVAISQFRSAKNSYIINIQLFFSQFQLNADFLLLLANTLYILPVLDSKSFLYVPVLPIQEHHLKHNVLQIVDWINPYKFADLAY